MKPQIENGYTRIANEIVEAMCQLKCSNYESRLLWCLFRKTYGFGKKEDRISLSQFSKLSGVGSQNMARAKTKLLNKKIIKVSGDKIGFQKDISKWIVSNEIVSKEIISSISIDTKTVSKEIHTKEKKETIQKKGRLFAYADYFFSFLKEESKEVLAKAKKFDLREKDVVFFAEQAMEWARGNEVQNNTWLWWDAFLNRWILRGIKQNKQRLTISDREAKQNKKPKYESVEDYYLKEEGVTIIG